ncbi:MAG TPA: sigma-54-dependent Fis family transcriptional regulator [Candidatus Binatia bacterium]|nr:sigma-54-dependent Fis family transcriptional regulator [Candidatus Binatia bacterium]
MFEHDRIALERELYLELLKLGKHPDILSFLTGALHKIVELTGAERGYIELGSEDARGQGRSWFAAHGCEDADIDSIRERVSRGVVAEAMSSGQTVLSHSALLDERFSARESVRAAGLEAVMCAPVGIDGPLGVIYLEGQRGSDIFTPADKAVVELFCEHLAPLADRALLREMHSADEPELADELRSLLGPGMYVGRSAGFLESLRTAATVAPLDVHVLLTGESGTGKTQLARFIHNASPRRAEPFVELNCAALPEDLIEKELFGAAPGAFTGAVKTDGKIAAAGRGTLFLDEVTELPPGAQPKLLQFLQSKEYSPLGSAGARRSEARIIAATNVDLRTAVAERKFREDLMYRLMVLPLRLPSLAERREDIDGLVDHFCSVIPARHGLPRLPLSPAARRAIRAAEWPGNLRQLEHTLEAAAIRAAGSRAESIAVSHLFPDKPGASHQGAETFQEATREFQAELLRRTLTEVDWNISECARRLDLARSHVYNLIQAFGITRAGE